MSTSLAEIYDTAPLTRPAWMERASRLHTQSPAQAQAWRDQGLDVDEVTDPAAFTAATKDPRVVWV